jgi:hypothetical protein
MTARETRFRPAGREDARVLAELVNYAVRYEKLPSSRAARLRPTSQAVSPGSVSLPHR